MLYCFLDTNIFLQYQTFDEIDWPKILGASKVCLVVPKRVIQELDKLKYDSGSRRKERANTALKKIQEYRQKGGDVRKNTTLKLQTSTPDAVWLNSQGYDPNVADDCIVGEAHYFSLTPPDIQLVIFSGDLGVRLKAEDNSLTAIDPPDDLKLSPEPDPLEKENKRLQRELLQLKNAQPRLSMKFVDQEGKFVQEIDFHISFKTRQLLEGEIEQKLKNKYDELKYKGLTNEEKKAESDSFAKSGLPNLTHLIDNNLRSEYPSQKNVDTYHSALNRFIKSEYRNYLINLNEFHNISEFIRPFTIILENSGTAPATNVDAWIHLPDGFTLSDEPPSQPNEPSPPQKPRVTNSLTRFMEIYGLPGHPPTPYIPPWYSKNYSEQPSGPSISIRKTNSYEIDWGTFDLKHNHLKRLPTYYLRFDPIDKKSAGFEIGYEITADNVPQKVKGKLVIRLHRSM